MDKELLILAKERRDCKAVDCGDCGVPDWNTEALPQPPAIS